MTPDPSCECCGGDGIYLDGVCPLCCPERPPKPGVFPHVGWVLLAILVGLGLTGACLGLIWLLW